MSMTMKTLDTYETRQAAMLKVQAQLTQWRGQRAKNEAHFWEAQPQQVRSTLLSSLQHIANPPTPLPESVLPKERTTAEMERLPADTVHTPAVSMRMIARIKTTHALINEAVQRFWTRHHCLPRLVKVNPLRSLHLGTPDFVPLEGLDELGCYTVSVECEPDLPTDAVYCQGHWGGIEEIYYL